jgi:hypothetical protein
MISRILVGKWASELAMRKLGGFQNLSSIHGAIRGIPQATGLSLWRSIATATCTVVNLVPEGCRNM